MMFDDIAPEVRARITVKLIVRAVAAATGVSEIDIASQRRQADIVAARHAVCWIARHLTRHSYPTIGARLGGRDHTTVMHGVDHADRLRAADIDYATMIDGVIYCLVALAVSAHERATAALGDPHYRDVDPLAAARKAVADGPGRAADRISELEIGAVCRRLIELDELACGFAGLLADIDAMVRARATAADRRAAAAVRARAAIPKLASALSALGYHDCNQETDDDDQEQDARPQCAGAAE